jgi:TonB family protein
MRSSHRIVALHFGIAVVLSLTLNVLGMSTSASAQPTSSGSEERERGIQLYKQGDAKGAVTQLQAALRKNKDDPKSWYYLGLSLTRDGQYKEASKAYEAVMKLQPDWASARAGLAFTLLLRNRLDAALSEAERALAIDSGLVDAYYTIGVVRLRNGDSDKALEAAEAVIRLNPNYAQGYLLKSQALVSFFQGTELPSNDESKERRKARYKEAAESLEKYLKLSPGTKSEATWHEQLEALQFMIGESGDARTTFSAQEVTVQARVLTRQEPSYTERARRNEVSGTVILRAIFTADGQVNHIFVVRGLPDGLTEQSIAAARTIKFTPATRDGKPVSMWMELQYNFSLY